MVGPLGSVVDKNPTIIEARRKAVIDDKVALRITENSDSFPSLRVQQKQLGLRFSFRIQHFVPASTFAQLCS